MLSIKFPLSISILIWPAVVLTLHVFVGAYVLGMLQAGCGVMEQEKTGSLHDSIEKYVCPYIRSLAAAYHQRLFPVFCPVGNTPPVRHGPCQGAFGIHAVGPTFCSTINIRYLGTRGKEAVSRLANLSKVCLWYSSLVSVWLLSSGACLVSVFLVSRTDGLYC